MTILSYLYLMSGIVENISLQWDLWVDEYRAFFPVSEEDLDACLQLGHLPQKRSEEITKVWAACQHTQTGDIVACLEIVNASSLYQEDSPLYARLFERIPPERVERMAVFRNLYSQDEQSSASLVLMSHCFVEVLKAGGEAVLMNCDPNHFYHNKRLGMRPVSALYRLPREEKQRIAMICVPDREYLGLINSPLLPLLRNMNFQAYQEICEWYYFTVRENSDLRTGSAWFPQNHTVPEFHHPITEGLSSDGIWHLLQNAFTLTFQEGEVILSENEGGRAFGYIQKGIVKVVIGQTTVVTLGEGDVLGEIAFILNSKRTAKVLAAHSGTEVVLFSEKAINELPFERDKMMIWRNLARIVAQRVLITNRMLNPEAKTA